MAELPESIWIPDPDEQGWVPAVWDRSTASDAYHHEYVRKCSSPVAGNELAVVLALIDKAPDAFAERYKSLHNRKRVDTDYVDRAVRKALLIMAEDIAEEVKKLGSMPEQDTPDDVTTGATSAGPAP